MTVQGRRICHWMTLNLLLGVMAPADAQVFVPADYNCPDPDPMHLLVETDTTLPLPADGFLCYTTVTVSDGATLSFHRNAANTPVHLLATGDITIDGRIWLGGGAGNTGNGGRGGPGAFDGGGPGMGDAFPPSAGHGPGAGQAGVPSRGAYATLPASAGPADGRIYGTPLLIPLIGGSGGGGTAGTPGSGGGGGGGAILLASNTRIDIGGEITTRGGAGPASPGGRTNGGSGGAIRLVAPIVAGGGLLRADPSGTQFTGGFGRIRVDALDHSEQHLNMTSTSSVGSFLVLSPQTLPRLYIIHAAGTSIPPGTPGPVSVILSGDAPSTQLVTVQAEDFVGTVDFEVVVTPDNGDRVVYPAQITTAAGNPPVQVNVNVEIPLNTITHIHAWVR